MCRTSFPAILWFIWKERNASCVNGEIASVKSLAESLRFTVASWLLVTHFGGYSLDQIMHIGGQWLFQTRGHVLCALFL